jgi:transcriptional regulator with PAS, ATPase and Fis domain
MNFELNSVFQSALNSINEAIYVLDNEMRIQFVNQRFYEIFEIPVDQDVIGLQCHEVSKGRLCANTGSLCEAIKNQQEFNNIDFTFETDSKVEKTIRHRTKKILDKDGNLVGGIGIYADISETSTLRNKIPDSASFNKIIGKNWQMLRMFDSIKQVAPTNATALILGDTGTGKELVADALHQCSKRNEGPYIKVNCSALSENILESELFGHVKGAFTGAIRDKIGKFELANKGTIFLDEIGELNKNIQVKLLRFLQEKEIEKVGDNKTIKVDVRIIAATNRDLKKEVNANKFREDLYYRLNVYPIRVPALKDRADDIELLTHSFLEKYSKDHNKVVNIHPNVITGLKRYHWPGNVRELQHIIEYSVIRSKQNTISVEDIPDDIRDTVSLFAPKTENEADSKSEFSRDTVVNVLESSGWNKSKASKSLQIGRTTLWRLMKKYHIEDPSKI